MARAALALDISDSWSATPSTTNAILALRIILDSEQVAELSSAAIRGRLETIAIAVFALRTGSRVGHS